MMTTILLVEDNPGDRRLIREALNEAGHNCFKVEWTDRLAAALQKLSNLKPDVIILDLSLPDSQGLDTFARVYAQAPGVPIVVVTDLKDEEVAIKAAKAGAQDYLLKSELSGAVLIRSLRYAIERKRAEESLRQLSAQLLRTQDEERRRIARELHDSVGQELVTLELNLAWIKGSLRRLGPKTQKVFGESFGIIEHSTQEIRDFSYLLHPPTLDESGLAAALRWYTDGFTRHTGIEVSLELSDDLPRQSRDVETALFRVAQECLTNVHRHSGSLTVSVRVIRKAGGLSLEVADHGRGMSSPAQARAGPRPGIGLAGMKERMRELGGTLEIASSSQGTTVRASLPLEDQKAA